MRKTTKIAFIAILLAELTISGYLLYRQFAFIAQIPIQEKDISQILSLGNCDNTLKNPFYLIGLPWAAWGLIYFGLLLTVFSLAHFLKQSFENEAYTTFFLLTLPAGVVSIFLLGSMFLGYAPFCGICVIVHLLHFTLIYLFGRIYPIQLKKVFKTIKTALVYLLLGKTENPMKTRNNVVVFLMLIFMILAIYQRLGFELEILKFYAQQHTISDNTLDNFFAQKPLDIPISNLDAQLGSKNAPIELILFSDFECPYCAEFSIECKKWLAAYPNKIRLIFKHYPLSNTCNPEMEQDMHPQACEAATAAQAALLQNKFWEFHDLLFKEGIKNDHYQSIIQKLQLDSAKFSKDMQSAEVSLKIKNDIQLANQLGVSGTPSAFLNKRKVENLHPELLKELIEKILQTKP